MDRGAWWATVRGVTRVRHNLATKPPQTTRASKSLMYLGKAYATAQVGWSSTGTVAPQGIFDNI